MNSSAPRFPISASRAALSRTSACAFSGLWMSISGSMIGTRPAPMMLAADLELLAHDGTHTGLVAQLDDRAHLRAEHAMRDRPGQDGVEVRHRLHDLRPVGLVGQALVDLQEGHDVLLLPQVLRGTHPHDLAVHRHLEQDRAEDALAVERGAGDDPGAHLVDPVVHLGVAGVGRLVDAVEPQRLGSAATTLVQCRDESLGGLDLLELLAVHESTSFSRVTSVLRRCPAPVKVGEHGPAATCAAITGTSDARV